MNDRLLRLMRLSERTGDRLIIHDPEQETDFVLLNLDAYEELLEIDYEEDVDSAFAEASADEDDEVDDEWDSVGDLLDSYDPKHRSPELKDVEKQALYEVEIEEDEEPDEDDLDEIEAFPEDIEELENFSDIDDPENYDMDPPDEYEDDGGYAAVFEDSKFSPVDEPLNTQDTQDPVPAVEVEELGEPDASLLLAQEQEEYDPFHDGELVYETPIEEPQMQEHGILHEAKKTPRDRMVEGLKTYKSDKNPIPKNTTEDPDTYSKEDEFPEPPVFLEEPV